MPAEIPLRIVVTDPPPGVSWAVQRGRADLIPPAASAADSLTFELTVTLAEPQHGKPVFRGAVAQGPPAGRFIYVNSGQRAGQAASCWNRRAKVSLGGISLEQVEGVLRKAGTVLEARFAGVVRDGGPACASVPLQGGGWRLVAARR